MSSSITIKTNPFERSNPFQTHSPSHPQITNSIISYHSRPTFRTFEPQLQSYIHKQNPYNKLKQQQLWKFRQDNCGKHKIFNNQGHQKYIQQKNNFEKQLVISNVAKRNKNNYGHQQVRQNQPVNNPFGRKYLMTSNTLAQSQVYSGFVGVGLQNITNYDHYKNQYHNYTPKVQYTSKYHHYYTPHTQQNHINQFNSYIGSNNNLQTSLYHKYNIQNQYISKKSIQRDDSYVKYNSHKSQIQSKYSLERQKQHYHRHSKESHKEIHLSNKDLPQNPFNKQRSLNIPSLKNLYSKDSRISGAQRDKPSKQFSRVTEKQQKVNFESSSDEDSHANYARYQRPEPTFGSKKSIHELKGPQQIIIHGCKFYRQKVQCY